MKKVIKYLFIITIVAFFSLTRLNAKYCTQENMSSFSATKCNSKAGGVTCPGWNYAKAYGFQKDDMLVVCYPGLSTDNKPMLFFSLFASDDSKNVCTKVMDSLYYNGKSYDGSAHSSWLSWNYLKSKELNGDKCPTYIYKENDEFLAKSYNVVLTDSEALYKANYDETDKFLWFTVGTAAGGGTIQDLISEDEVIKCVNDNIQNLCINNPNSSTSDIDTTIKNATKTCVENAKKTYGYALDDAAVNLFVDDVAKKIIASESKKLAFECKLMTKCSSLSSFKSSNKTKEEEAITGLYNNTITAADKLISKGVPSDLANCLITNRATAMSESEELITGVTTTVGEETSHWGSVAAGTIPINPQLEIEPVVGTCKEILGENLTNIVKAGITILQIAGAIIAIVKGMIVLIPAIASKDTDGLKKSQKQLISMAIILVVIFLLKPLISFIGYLFEYDLTCIL